MTKYIDQHGTPHQLVDALTTQQVFATQFGKNFFVLASSEGEVFNPLQSRIEDNTMDRIMGRMKFELSRCNQKCFQSYVDFLKTKKRIHLLIANRSFING